MTKNTIFTGFNTNAPLEGTGPDKPLRLDIAAAIAFPDGSMTASGLRRECKRGRLVIERIANKDYTTLANISRMRELCRVEAKVPDSGFGQKQENMESSYVERPGSSLTKADISPQAALRMKLKRQSANSLSTLPLNIGHLVKSATLS